MEKKENAASPSPNKLLSGPRLGLLLLLVWSAALAIWGFDPKVDLNGDNVAYLSLSRGILSGEGFCQTSDPACPPEKHFPPGYPLLLAAASLVSGDLLFLKALNGALLVACAFLLRALCLRLGLPPLLSLAAAFAVPANAHLLRSSTILMSEIPFLFWSLLLLWLAAAPASGRPFWKSPRFWAAAVVSAAAVYTRTAGVALPFGVVLALLAAKRRKEAAAFALANAALLLPWQIRNAGLAGESYASQLLAVNPYRPELGQAGAAELAARFGRNVARYLGEEIPSALAPAFHPDGPGAGGWILGILLVALAGRGLWKLPKGRALLGGVLLGSFGVMFLWPEVWGGVRFMLGTVPLLTVLALWGAQDLVSKKAKLPPAWAFAVPVLLLFGLGGVRTMARADYPAPWQRYKALAEWCSRNTPDTALVVARKPTLFWLWSSRRSVNYKLTTDADALIADLDSVGADYVVVEQLGYASTARNLVPAMQANPGRFAPVVAAQNPFTALYRFLPEPPPARSPESPSAE